MAHVDRPLPFAVAPFSLAMLWHERSTNEPGHVWIRDLMRELARTA